MNKYTILLSNTAIFAIGNILVKLISFLLMPLYTSTLTVDQYGVAELLNSGIEIVLPIGTLCIVDALYRFSIDEDANHKEIFANTIRIILIGDFVVFLFCVVWRCFFHYQYAYSFFMLYFATTLYKFTIQFARGLGHSRRYALYGVINALMLVASNIILLIIYHGGVDEYLASFTIAYGLTGIFAFFLSKEYEYFSLHSNIKTMNEMLRYSIANIPNMLSWWINNISARYIIMIFWGANLAGMFTAASKLPAMINLIASIFQQAWQYSTAKEIGKRNSYQFFNKVFEIYSLICLITCALLIIANKIICKILLQAEFYSAWKFVPLLLMGATIGCFSTFLGTFYNAIKNNTILMLSTVIGAGINILFSFILIPMYGGIGAAVANVIGYSVITIIRAIDISKRIGLRIMYCKFLVQFFGLSLIVYSSSVELSKLNILLSIIGLLFIVLLEIKTINNTINILKTRIFNT